MGRCGEVGGLADVCRAWPAGLDVSGAGGAANAPAVVGGGRRGDLPGARRSQPLLSPRDERGDPGLAARQVIDSGARGAPLTLRLQPLPLGLSRSENPTRCSISLRTRSMTANATSAPSSVGSI